MKTTLLISVVAAAGAFSVSGQEATTLKIPDGTPVEIREALTWFESLGLPSSRGRDRVRVTDFSAQVGGKNSDSYHLNGWLIEEKNGKWRLFCGPDVTGPFRMEADTPWPLEEWVVSPYSKTEGEWKHERTIGKTDFKAEAEALLTELKTPYDPKKHRPRGPDRFGMILSGRAAAFIMGRDCLEHGLAEPGLELLKLAPPIMRDVNETRTFRQLLEEEFATAALWKVTLEFSIPTISRESLLTNVEAALKRFPAAKRAEDLKTMAAQLRAMIAEDKQHAAKVKPFENMTPAEQAADLVFQLRNQTGQQDSQPGMCDIFSIGFAGGFTGPRTDKVTDATPAGKLVKLGYDAVPALIDALTSETLSRAVGFWRDFTFSHHVLTVGDCAQQTLEEIAGRSFYVRKTTSGYMSRDEKAAATKADAGKWWNSIKDKGERQALIDFVLAGDDDSPSQAFRLKERYPDDAPAVLLEGAGKCAESWPRTQMIRLLQDLKGEPVTAFLRKEMSEGPHSGSRSAALHVMLTRDPKAARRAMIEEWERLTGQFHGDERYHVMLQKYIGEDREFDSHEWTGRFEGMLQMIYLSGGPETIAAVAATYDRKPSWIRGLIVLTASTEDLEREAESYPPLPEPEREQAAAAIESLLLKALDDRADRHCDDAAERLHERWPQKFSWEETGSVRRRDAQIIAMKNVRRKELGQPPLSEPAPVKIPPCDESVAAPLLAALAAAKDDDAIAAAIDALASGPGLSVIPLVLKRLDASPKGDPQAARWQRAVAGLACIVREIEVDQNAKFLTGMPELAALKGAILTPEALQKALTACFLATPATVAGFHFRAGREDDGAGFVIRVAALTEKSSQSPDWWALGYAGNSPCRDIDGTGRGFYGNDFDSQADGFDDLKKEFVESCASWNRPAYVNYRAARQERR